MDKLSNELRRMICSEIASISDLKHLRLSYRAFASIGASYLFNEILIFPLAISRKRAKDISRDSTCGPMVKKIVFFPEILPFNLKPFSYELRVRGQGYRGKGAEVLGFGANGLYHTDKAGVIRGYARYQELFIEQLDFVSDNGMNWWPEVLRGLPNLKVIRTGYKHDYAYQENFEDLPKTLQATALETHLITEDVYQPHVFNSRSLDLLLHGISLANVKLDRLSLARDTANWNALALSDLTDRYPAIVSNALASLTHLEVSLIWDNDDLPAFGRPVSGLVRSGLHRHRPCHKFFEKASSVTHLFLLTPSLYSSTFFRGDSLFASTSYWPSLCVLQLSSMALDGDVLGGLLNRQRDTVQEVSFVDMGLLSQTWTDVLSNLIGSKLKSITVNCLAVLPSGYVDEHVIPLYLPRFETSRVAEIEKMLLTYFDTGIWACETDEGAGVEKSMEQSLVQEGWMFE
ncbi:hypothetical protein MMC13_000237 [Lambiella insularis]|nr:hypothetical protein [Lambiella insularis]